MIEYRGLRPLARSAILWTWIWLGAQMLYGLASAPTLMLMFEIAGATGSGFDSRPPELSTFNLTRLVAAFFATVASVASGFLILKWVHRINANAQLYSSEMNVSPGWNVGFFFVPIANLWKPFQGIRESWEVSDGLGSRVPGWMRWWWGCWLAANFINIAGFWIWLQADTFGSVSADAFLDMVSAIVAVPLALLLIRLIRTLTAAQEAKHGSETFA